ncbi:MAG: AAA domain-containing protein [Myxococcota bacterium]
MLHDLHGALASAGAYERDTLDRLLSLPVAERIAAGVAWPPLNVESCEFAGRDQTRLTLRAQRGVALHDGLGPGDRVDVSVAEHTWTGRIEDVGRGWAEVRVRGQGPESGTATITQLFDPAPWRRLADALARGDGHSSSLRDVLLGEKPPSLREHYRPTPLHPQLNAPQRLAGEASMAAAELALIHGPPGTGKTRLLVALLEALVKEGDRPWALADSNAAVDHLAERAAAAGLDVVRVGNWGRMSEAGRGLSLRRRIETGPHAQALRALSRDISQLSASNDRDARRSLSRLYGQRRDLERAAEDHALSGAQVIATTLGTLAWRAASLPPAQTAVVDEATQAIEPSIWAAVPYIDRLILAGDPLQLGPVVRQPHSPLSVSLLERLMDPSGPGLALPMLEIQHRMNEHIQDLVQHIYGDRYAAHPSVAEHSVAQMPGVDATELTRRSTLWIDTAGAGMDEQLDPATRSFENPGEAQLMDKVVDALLQAGVPAASIAIITPYSAQTRALQARLPKLEINSVNAFQGQEREIILCSWVRSNPDGNLGFVADVRRLTVAITRARRLWIGIGDSATLAGDPAFSQLFEVLESQDSMQSVWEPPWSA